MAAYITAAYWFTASTSFANPAVTIARAPTNTFSGIRPHDVSAFLAAQIAGARAATLLFRWLLPSAEETRSRRQFLDEALAKQSSVLITMGSGEACPLVPRLKREDWPLSDPKGQSVESVRAIRDEIKLRVEDLLARRGLAAR